MSIHVSIVEDDTALRNAITEWVASDKRFKIISEHGNAEEAIQQLPDKSPDVVLSDINLPGLSGIECVRQLKGRMPKTQFLMLTVYDDADRIFQALAAGATGYLVKRASRDALLTAIAEVHRGESPMSSGIARKIVKSFQRLEPPAASSTDTLTPREKQVLELLAQGYMYKEIADQLSLSIPTVNCYIRSIYEKLQVHSRSQAVAKFLRR
ncbi:MAG: response regulator transcription factor [Verrucomicrobiota bacterium]